MRIGVLAARAGVTQKAVRYYERCGLLDPGRTDSGYRDFDERELLVVRAIRQSQSLGFTRRIYATSSLTSRAVRRHVRRFEP
jgi:DNA-binding transcriptional MerR regulator